MNWAWGTRKLIDREAKAQTKSSQAFDSGELNRLSLCFVGLNFDFPAKSLIPEIHPGEGVPVPLGK